MEIIKHLEFAIFLSVEFFYAQKLLSGNYVAKYQMLRSFQIELTAFTKKEN